jgi:hypothetical protein
MPGGPHEFAHPPTLTRMLPLSKSRSLSSVSSVLRMALLALKISSMNATCVWGEGGNT